jgi:hypothetical protein
MKTYLGSGGIAVRILDLDARRRWMVSYTLGPLYSQGKNLSYSLDRRVGGLQSRSERGGEEKFQAPVGIRIPVHPARSPALYRWAIPTPFLNYIHMHVLCEQTLLPQTPFLADGKFY